MKLALSIVFVMALLAGSAQASRLWRWGYQGPEVKASGTLTTKDTADAQGFYEITEITGEANGIPIIGLQPKGTAVPGNEGFPVDNLIRMGNPQLTKAGFAFSLKNGAFANPFYAAHFPTPGYYAFLSNQAARQTSEPRVVFTAAVMP